jgi:hypothetical protein
MKGTTSSDALALGRDAGQRRRTHLALWTIALSFLSCIAVSVLTALSPRCIASPCGPIYCTVT